jgi:outer membrane biosynthesis protein TonB
MLRHAKTLAPSLTVAALLLGLAAPAFADVPPEPRKRTSRTIEAQHAPPMTPPLEQTPPAEPEVPQPEPAPPSQQAPETVQPTPPQAQPEAKGEAKGEAKAAADDKSGSCSIDADSEQTIVGIAALFMLLTSAAFLRRRG